MSPKPQKLVEGVDYYMEAGKLVFTTEYHLRRGHCCNSGCRHCPYRGEPAAAEPIRIVLPRLPVKKPG
ncbi:MAG: hypothetical protein IT372_37725 [Polyangiaceae bacterium]|nr:hypothetical protein [Polyangiaceae bacterium]